MANKHPLHIWLNQQGVFSPFMFGLLMASAIFSVVAQYAAKKELEAWQERQAQQQKEEAEDLTKAVEFAILTETAETYDDSLTLERALRYASRSLGLTQTGEQAQLLQGKGNESFGLQGSTVGFDFSSDPLRNAQLRQSARAGELSQNTSVTIDTSAIRSRQMQESVNQMNKLGEQLYAFYAGQLHFPTPTEYEILSNQLNLTDVWGQPFTYVRKSDTVVVIEFTTPWNYTHSMELNLK